MQEEFVEMGAMPRLNSSQTSTVTFSAFTEGQLWEIPLRMRSFSTSSVESQCRTAKK